MLSFHHLEEHRESIDLCKLWVFWSSKRETSEVFSSLLNSPLWFLANGKGNFREALNTFSSHIAVQQNASCAVIWKFSGTLYLTSQQQTEFPAGTYIHDTYLIFFPERKILHPSVFDSLDIASSFLYANRTEQHKILKAVRAISFTAWVQTGIDSVEWVWRPWPCPPIYRLGILVPK